MCYLIFRFLLWLVDCEHATVLAVPITFSLVVGSGAASPSDAVFDQEEGQFYQGCDRRTHESMLGGGPCSRREFLLQTQRAVLAFPTQKAHVDMWTCDQTGQMVIIRQSHS